MSRWLGKQTRICRRVEWPRRPQTSALVERLGWWLVMEENQQFLRIKEQEADVSHFMLVSVITTSRDSFMEILFLVHSWEEFANEEQMLQFIEFTINFRYKTSFTGSEWSWRGNQSLSSAWWVLDWHSAILPPHTGNIYYYHKSRINRPDRKSSNQLNEFWSHMLCPRRRLVFCPTSSWSWSLTNWYKTSATMRWLCSSDWRNIWSIKSCTDELNQTFILSTLG